MTIGSALNDSFVTSLRKLAQTSMPMHLAFKIRKILKKYSEEMSNYEALRQELLDKYSDKDDKGKMATITEKQTQLNPDGTTATSDRTIAKFSDENRKVFNEKYQELLNVEIKLPKFKLSEVPPTIMLTPAETLALEDVIEE